jgi:hypothetical protein
MRRGAEPAKAKVEAKIDSGRHKGGWTGARSSAFVNGVADITGLSTEPSELTTSPG